MLVERKHIRRSVNAKYTLWDGEMVVRVIQHTGVYGFHSAVIVVERLDGPLRTYSKSWYTQEALDAGKPREAVLDWVAETLTQLSKGTLGAAGTECEVQGLLQV